MINGERVIAAIPARGGSKALPRKNISLLGGKPLIVWSIEVAQRVSLIDRVLVSTDDEEIAAIARSHGAEVYPRPAHLATDTALVIDTIRDLIRTLAIEGEPARVMVLLEPTCPFRSHLDVEMCIEDLVQGGKDSVATFKEADLNPHRAWAIAGGSPSVFIPGANPWLPRQELPPAYQLNGAVYCFRMDGLPESGQGLLFGNAGAVIMPGERSVDINTPSDLIYAETIWEANREGGMSEGG